MTITREKKRRWPYAEALVVAQEIQERLKPYCAVGRCEIVGSIRRERREVGDVEILFVPTFKNTGEDMFRPVLDDEAAREIEAMLEDGTLRRRPNKNGVIAWGEKNKLATHVATGIPVDLFSTSINCWWNSLVMRTGGKENNVMLAKAAKRIGWSFEAYGSGFKRERGPQEHYQTTSEKDVYRFLGLECPLPEHRM